MSIELNLRLTPYPTQIMKVEVAGNRELYRLVGRIDEPGEYLLRYEIGVLGLRAEGPQFATDYVETRLVVRPDGGFEVLDAEDSEGSR